VVGAVPRVSQPAGQVLRQGSGGVQRGGESRGVGLGLANESS
jgi:hypothetical protein